MKILIDMNLSPDWVAVFGRYNIIAVHWSTVGDTREKDSVIMEWARTNGYILSSAPSTVTIGFYCFL